MEAAHLAHHAKQNDRSHRIFTSSPLNLLLIHGAHGATYSYVSDRMERDYTRPSVALWHDLDAVCGQTKHVDFSLYVSCAHGLGHSLTFYVSSRKASHTRNTS